MSAYAFPPLAVPTLPIVGRDTLFPVHRIYCVGRNFADHAIEMGGDPSKEAPFFFQKNPDTLVHSGATIPYPKRTNDVHHEVELVVALKEGGEDIAVARALDHVWGYGVGVDLTRRDLQNAAKDLGRPWDWGKAFDASAPCGPLRRARDIGHPTRGRVWLSVNGALRQEGDLGELIWPVADIVAIASRSMRLQPGDLIFTGTPAGVGALVRGDKVEGGVEGVGEISFSLA